MKVLFTILFVVISTAVAAPQQYGQNSNTIGQPNGNTNVGLPQNLVNDFFQAEQLGFKILTDLAADFNQFAHQQQGYGR